MLGTSTGTLITARQTNWSALAVTTIWPPALPVNTVVNAWPLPSVTMLVVESVAPPVTWKKTLAPWTGAPMMSTNVAVNWNELLVWAVIAPELQYSAPRGVGYCAAALLGAIRATASIASITAARGM